MSIVAAVVRDEQVFMGSDSFCTANVAYVTSPKVWKVGEVLYGIVGNADACAAIQHGCKFPGTVVNARSGGDIREDVDIERWVYHAILPRVKESLVKASVAEPVFNLLVGLRGRLFILEDNTSFEVMRPYAAIGSAEQIAYGAMYAKMNSRGAKPSPENIVRCAIEACNEFSPDCGEPVVVRS